MSTDYKTEYSNGKNVNTLNLGSYNDYGDGTPGKQVLAKQSPDSTFDVVIEPKGLIKITFNEIAAAAVGADLKPALSAARMLGKDRLPFPKAALPPGALLEASASPGRPSVPLALFLICCVS